MSTTEEPMTEPTEPPCFERRINAAERALCDLLDQVEERILSHDPVSYKYHHIVDAIYQQRPVIKNLCAVARDYMRRPEGE